MTLQELCDLVRQVAQTQGWNLSPAMIEAYAHTVAAAVTRQPSAYHTIICRCHEEYATIQALLQPDSVEQQAYVEEVRNTIGRFVTTYLQQHTFKIDDSVENIVQIVLAKLIKSIPAYNFRSKFTTWSHQIMANTIIDLHRRSTAKKRNLFDEVYLDEQVTHSAVAFEAATILMLACRQALAKHREPRLAQVFELILIHHFTQTEAAELLNTSNTTVNRLLKMLIEFLRSYLDDEK